MTGRRMSGNRCQCTACNAFFSSPRAFDRHRTGEYAAPGEFAHGRSCMSASEMDSAGWPINGKGYRMEPRLEGPPASIEDASDTLPSTLVPGP